MSKTYTGFITKYNHDKGFGFIKAKEFEDSIFIHIQDVKNKEALGVGVKVEFQVVESKKGLKAIQARYVGKSISPLVYFTLIGICLIVALTFGIKHQYPDLHDIEAYLLATNGVTALYYFFDKVIAGSRFTRVPEKTLHFLAAIGGWPSALFAQNIFRHKTIKASFRKTQFIIIAVWSVILGIFIYLTSST